MRILGVDPGLQTTGYAVIESSGRHPNTPRFKLVEAGVIRTKAGAGISDRLHKIYGGLLGAIEDLEPDTIVMEKLYAHYKHPATAILMGHARGVVCLLSGVKQIPLTSVASTHVKKSVTGKGHAGKPHVQRMVQIHLGLTETPEPPDVADAMAIALTYAFTLRK